MTSSNLRRVLLVDDEPHIIAAVRRELRLPPNDIYDYAVEAYSDPVAALNRCEEVKFDAVVSDYRMPEMDGVEFIKRMGAMQPDCARIVLSGQTDTPALVRMVNELGIYRFISKPWNPYYLKATLGQAIDYSEVSSRNRELVAAASGITPARTATEQNEIDQVLIVGEDASGLKAILHDLDSGNDEVRASPQGRKNAGAYLSKPHLAVQIAQSAVQALELTGQAEYSCIVADQNLPDMKGVDLLGQLIHRQPDCLRMLMGGKIDQEDLVRAVNIAHIFAFIEKPWNEFDLKKLLLQGLQRRRMFLENRLLANLLQPPAHPPASTLHELDPDDDQIKRG